MSWICNMQLQGRKATREPVTIVQEVAFLAQQAYQDPKRLHRTVTNDKDCQSYLCSSLQLRGYSVLQEAGIREAFADFRGPQKRNILMLDRKARPTVLNNSCSNRLNAFGRLIFYLLVASTME